jgi:hypothetical protein
LLWAPKAVWSKNWAPSVAGVVRNYKGGECREIARASPESAA